MRNSAVAIVAAALLAFGAAMAQGEEFKAEELKGEEFRRADWLADFEQLKTAITQQSPNLDWALARGLDLPALERETRKRLAWAQDANGARRALDRFVSAFGDGHMGLLWPSSSGSGASNEAPSTCASLGFQTFPDTGAIATALPGYQSFAPEQASIEGGVSQIGRARVGVLRLLQFAPNERQCAQALAALALPTNGDCDEACADRVARRANDVFLAEIAERIRALRAARPVVLLVDLAGNGGGNDTALAVARMLSAPGLQSPQIGMARSLERANALQSKADELAAVQGDAQTRAFLSPLIEALRAAQQTSAEACDMRGIWTGNRPSCSTLVRGPFYAGGLIASELPAHFRDAPWAETVSATARMQYQAGLWRGPLLVLVDSDTASSAELFAAMLQDSGGALIIGAPTFGAGCGWNLPRQDIVLSKSGARLEIPNCARFRLDGRNEIDGVEPDVLIGFRPHDTLAQRVQRLSARLPAALDKARQMPARGR